MARVKGAMMARKRRNKTLKLAKGYWGAKSKHFKMNYSTFMHGLKVAGIQINRKMLSEMAIYDAPAFAALCDIAKKA